MTRHHHRQLLELARAWLADDPDPSTREELRDLLEREDFAELAERFSGPLEFGTAGLRGELGAGPNRMNRVVVMRAAAGLAAYLGKQGVEPEAPVVIGFDARYRSHDFALDTAAIMAGAGLRPLLLPRPLPTPVLAFAIRHTGSVAGVMVTASHNPARDNGYKVYLGDGSQITPPADTGIADAIAAVGPIAAIPRGAVPTAEDRERLGSEVVEAYLRRVGSLPLADTPRRLTIAYTPMHGVGGEIAREAMVRAGFAEPVVVPEQADPDPDFPTVEFPNPEEPGAMDLVIALARERRADLVIANDPDADRCAVAVPDATASSGWRMLTGDEVGVLLGTHLARRGGGGVFATTIVSSTLLHDLATDAGLDYTETLTGFKWLSKTPNLRYAYEEALGYCVDPEAVRDKDGISAAVLIAEMAAACDAAGTTLLDELDQLARIYGLHATSQLSVRVTDRAEIDRALHTLRSKPPTILAEVPVVGVRDLSKGSEDLPATDGVRLTLGNSSRIVVRPSGTEPKLKCYLEVVVRVTGGDVAPARAQARRTLNALRDDLASAMNLTVPPG